MEVQLKVFPVKAVRDLIVKPQTIFHGRIALAVVLVFGRDTVVDDIDVCPRRIPSVFVFEIVCEMLCTGGQAKSQTQKNEEPELMFLHGENVCLMLQRYVFLEIREGRRILARAGFHRRP